MQHRKETAELEKLLEKWQMNLVIVRTGSGPSALSHVCEPGHVGDITSQDFSFLISREKVCSKSLQRCFFSTMESEF